ncbi:MAG: polysaccharide deacetylase [Clostridiales bacterium]|nr:polysaccharide deacetylase [Clostridiales bacterium]
MKVYRNVNYRHKLIMRRAAIITVCIAIVAALAVAISLVASPLGKIPVQDPNAPVTPESSQAPLEPITNSSSESVDPIVSSASSNISSNASSDADTSSGKDWTPPVPPANGPAYTKLYPNLYCEPVKKAFEEDRVIYLTFDDGPSPNTDIILDVLKENGIKATFFVTAQNPSEANMNRMKRIVEEGHAIGVHTYTHNFREVYASVEAYLDDFNKMYEKVVEVTGVKPTVFRFPGGSNASYNKAIRDDLVKEMTRRGFTFFDWNIDSSDATGNNIPADKIVSHTLSTSQGFQHGIVLMHDLGTKKSTADALPRIIAGLKEQGYTFDKITDKTPSVNFLPKQKD